MRCPCSTPVFEWYVVSLPGQVVLCGDFYQLPPVGGRGTDRMADADAARHVAEARRQVGEDAPPQALAERLDAASDDGGWKGHWETTPFGLAECKGKYAFQTVAWHELGLHAVVLTRVYRTSDDVLLHAQRAIREGRVEDAAVAALVAAAARPLPRACGVQPTQVLSLKRDVAEERARLARAGADGGDVRREGCGGAARRRGGVGGGRAEQGRLLPPGVPSAASSASAWARRWCCSATSP